MKYIILATAVLLQCTLGANELLVTDLDDINNLGIHPDKIIRIDTLDNVSDITVYKVYWR